MNNSFIQFEENEYEIGRTLTEYYNLDNVIINPTINPYAPLDLHFTYHSKMKPTDYSCEIKCRNKYYSSMIIEMKKLVSLIDEHNSGKETRYINYIEETDTLIIYDITSRLNKNLELWDIKENPTDPSNYVRLPLPRNTAENNGERIKHIKYLYYNPFQTKDMMIENYKEKLLEKKINFNYKPIEK